MRCVEKIALVVKYVNEHYVNSNSLIIIGFAYTFFVLKFNCFIPMLYASFVCVKQYAKIMVNDIVLAKKSITLNRLNFFLML